MNADQQLRTCKEVATHPHHDVAHHFVRILVALCAVCIPAGAVTAQPFAVAGAACGLGRADDRGLHRVYWELLDLTEICLDAPNTPSAVRLSFILVYPGKGVAAEPVSILIRVQAHVWVGPELPAFSLNIDGRRLELMSPNRRHELVYPCPPGESCAFTGVVAALTEDELRLISKSSLASGQIFGSDFTVSVEALRAVGHLVALLGSAK